MMSSKIRIVLALFPLTLLGSVCNHGTVNNIARLELKLGHVSPPGSMTAECAEEFARRANERLGDRAAIVVFGSSQLGSDEIMLQKLKLGTVDFSVPSTIMSSMVEEFGLFEMPYLIQDREHMRLIERDIFWPKLAPAAEAKGYKVLGVWENGFRHITTNRRPVVSAQDLRGIRLRVPRGQWRLRLFQVLGANPTPMPLSEVFVALQTGVIDGQENPLAQLHSSKFHEVQTYLSLTEHVYSPSYLLAGANRWRQLPEDVRRVLEETARSMKDFVFELAVRKETELLDELRASGLQVNRADRESFLEASRKIYEEFASSVAGGREMIDTALALADPKQARVEDSRD